MSENETASKIAQQSGLSHAHKHGNGTRAHITKLVGGCFDLPPWPPKQPNVVSLDPQDWYIFHSDDMPVHPSADSTGAWSFTIPRPDGHVNYIQTPFNATEVLHNVTITFKIESNVPKYLVIDRLTICRRPCICFSSRRALVGDLE